MEPFIFGTIENQTTYGMTSFRIEGGVFGAASDADILDLAERIRDSDLLATHLPGGTLAITALQVGGLGRQVNLS